MALSLAQGDLGDTRQIGVDVDVEGFGNERGREIWYQRTPSPKTQVSLLMSVFNADGPRYCL